MADIVIGLFRDREGADDAIDELGSIGFEAEDISVVAPHDTVVHEKGSSSVAEGAVSGMATGGVIGGLAGLLIGIGALAIPGGFLIGGPIAAALGLTGAAATTLSGAATGAVAGGLIGSLVGLGVPEEDARYYEQGVSEGGVVIAVPVSANNSQKARTILKDNGAERVHTFPLHEGSRKRVAA